MASRTIAFCGCDTSLLTLQALINDGHRIAQVFTFNSSSPLVTNTALAETAQEIGATLSLEDVSVQVSSVKDTCDLLISHIYPHRISTDLTAAVCSFNIHPSPLPEGRGIWPAPTAILRELPVYGVTAHKHAPAWDAGDILGQKTFDLGAQDTLAVVMTKLSLAAAELATEVVRQIDPLWHLARPQQAGSYWKMPSIEDRTINWTKTGAEIERLSRAYGMFGVYARLGETTFVLEDVRCFAWAHDLRPGTIIEAVVGTTTVATGDGFASIRHKRALSADAAQG